MLSGKLFQNLHSRQLRCETAVLEHKVQVTNPKPSSNSKLIMDHTYSHIVSMKSTWIHKYDPTGFGWFQSRLEKSDVSSGASQNAKLYPSCSVIHPVLLLQFHIQSCDVSTHSGRCLGSVHIVAHVCLREVPRVLIIYSSCYSLERGTCARTKMYAFTRTH